MIGRVVGTEVILCMAMLIVMGCSQKESCHLTASENPEETIRSECEEFDLAWCFYGLTANPTKPTAGQPVEFSVWLMVPDVVERPGKAFLVVNGEVVEHCDIFFDADCTELLKMEHTFTKPGNYEVRIDAAVGKNAAYQPGSHEQIMHIKVIE